MTDLTCYSLTTESLVWYAYLSYAVELFTNAPHLELWSSYACVVHRFLPQSDEVGTLCGPRDGGHEGG
jgi:hypothetical protein